MIIIKIQAGLGNQLFQYATGRALSLHFNTELKVDLSFYNEPKNENAYRLNKFNLPIAVANSTELNHLKNPEKVPFFYKVLNRFGLKLPSYYKHTHILEKQISRLYNPKQTLIKDCYIEGWFADENYFINYRETILNDIISKLELSQSNAYLQTEIKGSNSVAVHIRRGDYLSNTYFKVLPIGYYMQAIKMAMDEISNPVFYFFSNDPVWVKKEFSYLPNAHFVEHNSDADTEYSTKGDISDLMLICSCKHQIIANSSFSWWGAWLNENASKKVFYPGVYYNNTKAQKQYEKKSFMPAEWIKIQF